MWKLPSILMVLALSQRVRAKWVQTFASEFNGAAGSGPGEQWAFDIGGGSKGWGNQERQFYTNNRTNAHLDGQGHLLITAVKAGASNYSCWYGPCQYTSARLKTQSLFSQQYGRFEVNAKVPAGQGLWPAFWMLGADFSTVSWPQCGEIDVMEVKGQQPNSVAGTIHGPGYSGSQGITASFALPAGQSFANAYHNFSVEWGPQNITWTVDGQPFRTTIKSALPAGAPWVFDQPFFMLLNLAVGGLYVGSPAPSLSFPQALSVDYVRVYRQQ